MTDDETLQALIEYIVKQVPDIREHHNRCMNCGYGFEYCKQLPATEWGRPACKPNESYEDRSIVLEDILRAFPQRLFAKADSNRTIELFPKEDLFAKKSKNIYVQWEAGVSLHNQPSAVWKFLHAFTI